MCSIFGAAVHLVFVWNVFYNIHEVSIVIFDTVPSVPCVLSKPKSLYTSHYRSVALQAVVEFWCISYWSIVILFLTSLLPITNYFFQKKSGPQVTLLQDPATWEVMLSCFWKLCLLHSNLFTLEAVFTHAVDKYVWYLDDRRPKKCCRLTNLQTSHYLPV